MKVLLVGPYPPDSQFSIGAFGSALERGLSQLGVEVQVTMPRETQVSKALRQLLGRRRGQIDKFLLFPRELRRLSKGADVIHVLEHGYASYVRHLRRKANVVTCHDLIVAKAALGEIPDWPLSLPARMYQASILDALGRSNQVAAVSQATLDDVVSMARKSVRGTTLIYNGFYRPMYRMTKEDARPRLSRLGVAEGQPFLLHVGGNQPNKNRAGLVEIFGKLQEIVGGKSPNLVLAGHSPNRALLERIARLPRPERVFVLERPEDEDVIALYSSAEALLFPSLYEGFGLPIIEAQACGCPVITSNRPPMTEVGGNAASYIDPEQPENAAHQILSFLASAHEFIDLGMQNVKRFSTEAMCAGYQRLYQEIS